jgi:hypothetical protein
MRRRREQTSPGVSDMVVEERERAQGRRENLKRTLLHDVTPAAVLGPAEQPASGRRPGERDGPCTCRKGKKFPGAGWIKQRSGV